MIIIEICVICLVYECETYIIDLKILLFLLVYPRSVFLRHLCTCSQFTFLITVEHLHIPAFWNYSESVLRKRLHRVKCTRI